ncbi:hypothetical protein [Thalassospira lucentensis]|uniref:hypothetical protein n=1 Tax=Thalassospira lucentensis TaxID=168935 RepID=UPI003AA828CE
MKRNYPNNLEWNVVHARKSWHRKLVSRLKKKNRNRAKLGLTAFEIPSRRKFDFKSCRHLDVPEVMNFRDAYDDTVKFIRYIFQQVVVKKRYVLLHFEKCREISTAACVVLAAEVFRCERLRPYHINGKYPLSEDVHAALSDIGFYKLINVVEHMAVSDDPDRYIVKLQTGKRGQPQLIDTIKKLLFGDVIKLTEKQLGNQLYRGLTEAMLNVHHHAYPDDIQRTDWLVDQWWMTGHRDYRKREVQFLFYDQGVGIPHTLPKKWPEIVNSMARLVGAGVTSADLIEKATEIGQTSTKKQGRGRGLNDLRRLIENETGGELRLLSGNGEYIYSANGESKKKNRTDSLDGTLVVWTIRNSEMLEWVE